MTGILRYWLLAMSNLLKHCNSDWFHAVAESEHHPGMKLKGHPLPGFPEEKVQRGTTGATGRQTLCEAYIFYDDCLDIFRKHGNAEFSGKVLLDFGTGWGRILRFFMKEFDPERLIGVDINSDLLAMCRRTFSWGTFLESKPYPPIELPEDSVDYIVGYSVFSHLSESACRAWIEEFHRILRPGGMALLTTRGRWFLDYCESLQRKDTEGYQKALSCMFDDFSVARRKYDLGEFLHANSQGLGGGGPLNATFYGETWIPETYAKKNYADLFHVNDYVYHQGRSTHPIMVMQKRRQ